MQPVSIQITFNKQKTQSPTALPQAEIITGVVGSVLAIQLNDLVYAVDMLSIIQAITQSDKNTVEVLPDAKG